MMNMEVGPMDNDKVSVNIKEIENGFVVSRSWCEKKGKNYDYKDEQFFMKSLPADLAKMFKKGSNKDMDEAKEEKDGYEEADKKAEELMRGE